MNPKMFSDVLLGNVVFIFLGLLLEGVAGVVFAILADIFFDICWIHVHSR